MVFYAFLKYVTGNVSNEPNYRYLITAPDADTIDEWWRTVSDPRNKTPGYQRLSPDFYTYTKLSPWEAAPEFAINKIIFTLLHDRDGRILSLFPNQERTDARSGQTFFIRSKSKPDVSWWVDSRGSVVASATHRSRFHFEMDDGEDGTVMIGKDKISISYVEGKSGAVTVEHGRLCIGDNNYSFKFGDLKKLFLTEHSDAPEHSPQIWVVKKGFGEEWELVK